MRLLTTQGNVLIISQLKQVEVFQSEKALLEAFIDATQALDPDIILGFEVQKGSLGYLADRAATMDLPLLKLVSRTPEVGSTAR